MFIRYRACVLLMLCLLGEWAFAGKKPEISEQTPIIHIHQLGRLLRSGKSNEYLAKCYYTEKVARYIESLPAHQATSQEFLKALGDLNDDFSAFFDQILKKFLPQENEKIESIAVFELIKNSDLMDGFKKLAHAIQKKVCVHAQDLQACSEFDGLSAIINRFDLDFKKKFKELKAKDAGNLNKFFTELQVGRLKGDGEYGFLDEGLPFEDERKLLVHVQKKHQRRLEDKHQCKDLAETGKKIDHSLAPWHNRHNKPTKVQCLVGCLDELADKLNVELVKNNCCLSSVSKIIIAGNGGISKCYKDASTQDVLPSESLGIARALEKLNDAFIVLVAFIKQKMECDTVSREDFTIAKRAGLAGGAFAQMIRSKICPYLSIVADLTKYPWDSQEDANLTSAEQILKELFKNLLEVQRLLPDFDTHEKKRLEQNKYDTIDLLSPGNTSMSIVSPNGSRE